MLRPLALLLVLLIASPRSTLAQVGLGNHRDLSLRSAVGGGFLTDAAKLAGYGSSLTLHLGSPQGTLAGSPVFLVVDLRSRMAESGLLELPGEPGVFGVTGGCLFLVEGTFSGIPAVFPGVATLDPGGYQRTFTIPDLTPLGDISMWIQGATVDPFAPNGLAVTNTIRHDVALLQQQVSVQAAPYGAGALLGYGLTAADLDGDGYADLIAGLPGAHAFGVQNAGELRVHFGPDQTRLVALTAPVLQAGASFGNSVRVGDVNGDGVPDLVVGARHQDVGGVVDAGAVHVFLGPSFSTATTLVSPSPEATARFGHAVAVADWTGDGIGDVIVGAPRESSGGALQAGRVYVFAGPFFNGPPIVIESPAPQAYAKFGYALGAGDIDGMPGQDLVIGCPFHDVNVLDDTGRAYVFLAPSVVPAHLIEQPEDTGAVLGGAITMADFDQDGHLDVAIGAEFDDELVLDGGSVHVAYGPTFSFRVELTSPAAAMTQGFGSDVASGDVNRDGYPDVVVGAFWREVDGVVKAGGGWVLLGPQFDQALDLLAPVPGAQDQVGRRAACADLDGDGFANPILGAPAARGALGNSQGCVHLFLQ